jgi:DNA-binding LacI/PurR family transcriptional regulator
MTIREVARRAGVSLQTVSNVINGRTSQVGQATRERVERWIAELGYQPNAQARGLRSQRTGTIAFLTLDPAARFMADPFHSVLLSGMADAARDTGHCLLVQALAPEDPVGAFSRLFGQKRFDGAAVHLSGPSAERRRWVKALASGDAPFVLMEERAEGARSACVRADNQHGALTAVQYLRERGHNRIAFLTAARDWPAFDERLAGYQEALRTLRLGTARKWVAEGETVEDAQAEMEKRLAREPVPFAVLCANDVLALGTLQAAKALGRRVPDEVAVIGFDDHTFARYVNPSLTTVALPGYEMGRRAAELLIGFLRHGEFAEREARFETRLIPRESA